MCNTRMSCEFWAQKYPAFGHSQHSKCKKPFESKVGGLLTTTTRISSFGRRGAGFEGDEVVGGLGDDLFDAGVSPSFKITSCAVRQISRRAAFGSSNFPPDFSNASQAV
jgi:hypothetical protein